VSEYALKPYLQLMRPANLVTAVADIAAGVCLASLTGAVQPESLGWLALSTLGLYGGGVVFNDFFDAELDAVERPERPIPSGRVTKTAAGVLAGTLLAFGVAMAFLNSTVSGPLALAVALLTIVYDRFAKPNVFLGPLTMGACRGGNLLLGLSAVDTAPFERWNLALVPVLYIFAVTLISRGEVHGGKRAPLYFAGILFLLVQLAQWGTAHLNGHAFLTIPYLVLHGALLYPPLIQAYRQPTGPNIGGAVKAGVISLILMNAAWAAAAGQWLPALGIAALLPISRFLARKFAVT
jgi:4-hydroxybenzoate polyprenyltransferase